MLKYFVYCIYLWSWLETTHGQAPHFEVTQESGELKLTASPVSGMVKYDNDQVDIVIRPGEMNAPPDLKQPGKKKQDIHPEAVNIHPKNLNHTTAKNKTKVAEENPLKKLEALKKQSKEPPPKGLKELFKHLPKSVREKFFGKAQLPSKDSIKKGFKVPSNKNDVYLKAADAVIHKVEMQQGEPVSKFTENENTEDEDYVAKAQAILNQYKDILPPEEEEGNGENKESSQKEMKEKESKKEKKEKEDLKTVSSEDEVFDKSPKKATEKEEKAADKEQATDKEKAESAVHETGDKNHDVDVPNKSEEADGQDDSKTAQAKKVEEKKQSEKTQIKVKAKKVAKGKPESSKATETDPKENSEAKSEPEIEKVKTATENAKESLNKNPEKETAAEKPSKEVVEEKEAAKETPTTKGEETTKEAASTVKPSSEAKEVEKTAASKEEPATKAGEEVAKTTEESVKTQTTAAGEAEETKGEAGEVEKIIEKAQQVETPEEGSNSTSSETEETSKQPSAEKTPQQTEEHKPEKKADQTAIEDSEEAKVGKASPDAKVEQASPEAKVEPASPDAKVDQAASEAKVEKPSAEAKVGQASPEAKVEQAAPEASGEQVLVEGKTAKEQPQTATEALESQQQPAAVGEQSTQGFTKAAGTGEKPNTLPGFVDVKEASSQLPQADVEKEMLVPMLESESEIETKSKNGEPSAADQELAAKQEREFESDDTSDLKISKEGQAVPTQERHNNPQAQPSAEHLVKTMEPEIAKQIRPVELEASVSTQQLQAKNKVDLTAGEGLEFSQVHQEDTQQQQNDTSVKRAKTSTLEFSKGLQFGKVVEAKKPGSKLTPSELASIAKAERDSEKYEQSADYTPLLLSSTPSNETLGFQRINETAANLTKARAEKAYTSWNEVQLTPDHPKSDSESPSTPRDPKEDEIYGSIDNGLTRNKTSEEIERSSEVEESEEWKKHVYKETEDEKEKLKNKHKKKIVAWVPARVARDDHVTKKRRHRAHVHLTPIEKKLAEVLMISQNEEKRKKKSQTKSEEYRGSKKCSLEKEECHSEGEEEVKKEASEENERLAEEEETTEAALEHATQLANDVARELNETESIEQDTPRNETKNLTKIDTSVLLSKDHDNIDKQIVILHKDKPTELHANDIVIDKHDNVTIANDTKSIADGTTSEAFPSVTQEIEDENNATLNSTTAIKNESDLTPEEKHEIEQDNEWSVEGGQHKSDGATFQRHMTTEVITSNHDIVRTIPHFNATVKAGSPSNTSHPAVKTSNTFANASVERLSSKVNSSAVKPASARPHVKKIMTFKSLREKIRLQKEKKAAEKKRTEDAVLLKKLDISSREGSKLKNQSAATKEKELNNLKLTKERQPIKEVKTQNSSLRQNEEKKLSKPHSAEKEKNLSIQKEAVKPLKAEKAVSSIKEEEKEIPPVKSHNVEKSFDNNTHLTNVSSLLHHEDGLKVPKKQGYLPDNKLMEQIMYGDLPDQQIPQVIDQSPPGVAVVAQQPPPLISLQTHPHAETNNLPQFALDNSAVEKIMYGSGHLKDGSTDPISSLAATPTVEKVSVKNATFKPELDWDAAVQQKAFEQKKTADMEKKMQEAEKEKEAAENERETAEKLIERANRQRDFAVEEIKKIKQQKASVVADIQKDAPTDEPAVEAPKTATAKEDGPPKPSTPKQGLGFQQVIPPGVSDSNLEIIHKLNGPELPAKFQEQIHKFERVHEDQPSVTHNPTKPNFVLPFEAKPKTHDEEAVSTAKEMKAHPDGLLPDIKEQPRKKKKRPTLTYEDPVETEDEVTTTPKPTTTPEPVNITKLLHQMNLDEFNKPETPAEKPAPSDVPLGGLPPPDPASQEVVHLQALPEVKPTISMQATNDSQALALFQSLTKPELVPSLPKAPNLESAAPQLKTGQGLTAPQATTQQGNTITASIQEASPTPITTLKQHAALQPVVVEVQTPATVVPQHVLLNELQNALKPPEQQMAAQQQQQQVPLQPSALTAQQLVSQQQKGQQQQPVAQPLQVGQTIQSATVQSKPPQQPGVDATKLPAETAKPAVYNLPVGHPQAAASFGIPPPDPVANSQQPGSGAKVTTVNTNPQSVPTSGQDAASRPENIKGNEIETFESHIPPETWIRKNPDTVKPAENQGVVQPTPPTSREHAGMALPAIPKVEQNTADVPALIPSPSKVEYIQPVGEIFDPEKTNQPTSKDEVHRVNSTGTNHSSSNIIPEMLENVIMPSLKEADPPTKTDEEGKPQMVDPSNPPTNLALPDHVIKSTPIEAAGSHRATNGGLIQSPQGDPMELNKTKSNGDVTMASAKLKDTNAELTKDHFTLTKDGKKNDVSNAMEELEALMKDKTEEINKAAEKEGKDIKASHHKVSNLLDDDDRVDDSEDDTSEKSDGKNDVKEMDSDCKNDVKEMNAEETLVETYRERAVVDERTHDKPTDTSLVSSSEARADNRAEDDALSMFLSKRNKTVEDTSEENFIKSSGGLSMGNSAEDYYNMQLEPSIRLNFMGKTKDERDELKKYVAASELLTKQLKALKKDDERKDLMEWYAQERKEGVDLTKPLETADDLYENPTSNDDAPTSKTTIELMPPTTTTEASSDSRNDTEEVGTKRTTPKMTTPLISSTKKENAEFLPQEEIDYYTGSNVTTTYIPAKEMTTNGSRKFLKENVRQHDVSTLLAEEHAADIIDEIKQDIMHQKVVTDDAKEKMLEEGGTALKKDEDPTPKANDRVIYTPKAYYRESLTPKALSEELGTTKSMINTHHALNVGKFGALPIQSSLQEVNRLEAGDSSELNLTETNGNKSSQTHGFGVGESNSIDNLTTSQLMNSTKADEILVWTDAIRNIDDNDVAYDKNLVKQMIAEVTKNSSLLKKISDGEMISKETKYLTQDESRYLGDAANKQSDRPATENNDIQNLLNTTNESTKNIAINISTEIKESATKENPTDDPIKQSDNKSNEPPKNKLEETKQTEKSSEPTTITNATTTTPQVTTTDPYATFKREHVGTIRKSLIPTVSYFSGKAPDVYRTNQRSKIQRKPPVHNSKPVSRNSMQWSARLLGNRPFVKKPSVVNAKVPVKATFKPKPLVRKTVLVNKLGLQKPSIYSPFSARPNTQTLRSSFYKNFSRQSVAQQRLLQAQQINYRRKIIAARQKYALGRRKANQQAQKNYVQAMRNAERKTINPYQRYYNYYRPYWG